MSGDKQPTHAPKTLPVGVIGLDGWADPLLVVSFCVWQMIVAWQAIRVRRLADAAGSSSGR